MAESDVVRALTPVVAALEQLGVAYQVGGSIATSAWGVPRSTLDVDIVAQLELAHAQPLADTLQAHYYVDVEMIREAVRLRRSFNVIHLPTMLKVDVFVLKTRDFDRQAFARGVSDRLEEGEDARTFVLASPEDMILYKLEWFRL